MPGIFSFNGMRRSGRAVRRLRLFGGIGLMGVLGMVACPVMGQQSSWTLAAPTEGDWLDVNNWTNGLPGEFRDGSINNHGVARVDSGNAAAFNVFVGKTIGGTLRITGGELTSYQNMIVGQASSATGLLEVSGGHLSGIALTVGEFGEGTFNLTGGYVEMGRVWVGSHGVGEINHSGGTLETTAPVQITGGNGGDGRYVMDGVDAVLLAESIGVGVENAQAGVMVQSAGRVEVINDLTLRAQGSYLLQGTGELDTRRLFVNGTADQNATFTHEAGLADIAVYTAIGTDLNSHGSYEINGGELTTGQMVVGGRGQGRFEQNGGTVIATTVEIGQDNLGQGEYEMFDGLLQSDSLRVGLSGPATFIQHGGTVDVDFLRMESPIFDARYELHGGSFVVNERIEAAGILDFTNASVTLSVGAGSVIDLTQATILNSGAARFETGPGSIVLLPPGTDLSTQFNEVELFESMTYVPGTTFHVEAGRVVALGRDFEINDHALIEGTLKPDGDLFFKSGLTVESTGVVDLGREAFVDVEDSVSGVFGGIARLFDLNIGERIAGTFHHDGGEVAVTGSLRVGQDPGGFGQYLFTEGMLTVEEGFVSGENGGGRGEVQQSGGTATYRHLSVGLLGNGTYELSGDGEVEVDRLTLGRGGEGEIVQTGGSMTVNEHLYIGRINDGTGNYTLHGGTLTALEVTIGEDAQGQMEQTGGTVQVVGTVRLADEDASAQGTYEMQGGVLSADRVHLGTNGTGVFDHSGGTVNVARDLTVGWGQRGLGAGLFDLSGDATLITDATVVGVHKVGEFRQIGGTHEVNRLIIGEHGTYQFDDGVLEIESELTVAGELDLQDAAVTIPLNGGIMTMGQATVTNAQNATLSLDGQSLLIHESGDDPATIFGTYTNAGLTHQAGSPLLIPNFRVVRGAGRIDDAVLIQGSLFAEGPLALPNTVHIGPTARLDLGTHLFVVTSPFSAMEGGELFAGRMRIAQGPAYQFAQSGGSAILDSLTIETSGIYTLSGGTLEVSRLIDGEGTLDFADGAALLRTRGTTYMNLSNLSVLHAASAMVFVDDQSLVSFPAGFDPQSHVGLIEGDGFVHVAGDSLTIPEGRSVFPFGEFTGDLVNAGQFSPGDGTEVLEIEGTYVQEETGVLAIEIDGERILGRTTIYFDRLSADEISLAGDLDVQLLNGFLPDREERYVIITSPELTGRFANANARMVLDEGIFEILYDEDSVELVHFHASMGLGDLNGDSTLDAFDVSAFELALSDEEVYQNLYPELRSDLLGDFNDDGEFDAFDVRFFEVAMVDATIALPEPATLTWFVLVGSVAFPRLFARRDHHFEHEV